MHGPWCSACAAFGAAREAASRTITMYVTVRSHLSDEEVADEIFEVVDLFEDKAVEIVGITLPGEEGEDPVCGWAEKEAPI